jgi:hypothetical protein
MIFVFKKIFVASFVPQGANRVHIFTVPTTNTGGQEEYSKAIGRTMLKELGKAARCNLGRYRAISNGGRSE